jgi:hypothetical protein
MYNRDRITSLRLPLPFLLVLVVCVCSLAIHFVAEGLAPVAGGPEINRAGLVEQAHLLIEHCDEDFIFPCLIQPPAEHSSISLPYALISGVHSFTTSPLPQPPDS